MSMPGGRRRICASRFLISSSAAWTVPSIFLAGFEAASVDAARCHCIGAAAVLYPSVRRDVLASRPGRSDMASEVFRE